MRTSNVEKYETESKKQQQQDESIGPKASGTSKLSLPGFTFNDRNRDKAKHGVSLIGMA